MKLVPVNNCKQCHHCTKKLTKGYGYAMDYDCQLTGRCIAGYVEWPSEEPQDGVFPDWCPLKDMVE